MKWLVPIIVSLLVVAGCNGQEKGVTYAADKKYYSNGSESSGFEFLRKVTGNKLWDNSNKEYEVIFPSSFTAQHCLGHFLFYRIEKEHHRT